MLAKCGLKEYHGGRISFTQEEVAKKNVIRMQKKCVRAALGVPRLLDGFGCAVCHKNQCHALRQCRSLLIFQFEWTEGYSNTPLPQLR